MLDIEGTGVERKDRLDTAVDKIRAKYGNNSLRRATILQDERLSGTDVKGEHVISFTHIEDGPND